MDHRSGWHWQASLSLCQGSKWIFKEKKELWPWAEENVPSLCYYERQSLLMLDALMKDGLQSALCWLTTRWQQDDSQMGRNQDSTLVFWEFTSWMLMTSVLTRLSYTGLSKADSSVILSYGGRDVGILIDFPWRLGNEWRNREKYSKGPYKGWFQKEWIKFCINTHFTK